ncbi:ATP-dependent helicase HepA [Faecalibacterium prausnitzii]|nr:DEAD/DEAH box helicase [Faecalibacterium prausnitzii]VUX22190.1 ATP-dependent helicase HepA [Faecalibacterium prausnitzii]
MDREEIRYLLGSTIYARAKAYENRVQDLECETAENGVRHLSADVRGSGRNLYRTQAWLRQNGSFVSASCTCSFNENGEGPCCKHIGALLLHEVDEPEEKTESKPEKKALLDIPGVQRGTEFAKEAAARKDSYVSGLEMLFGRKWRGDEPVSDVRAQELLRAYQEDALAEVESLTVSDGQQRGFAELEPELILDYSGQPPLLRLRISDGGRQYVVKSIQKLLTAIEKERSVSYGKTLAFVHRWDAFTSEAQKILTLLRRQQDTVKSVEAATGRPTRSIANGPAGSVPLSGELLDELVVLYEPRGEVGGYALRKGLPALTLRVEKKRGGVHIVVEPSLYTLQGLDYSYLYNEDTIWKLERAEAARLLPALNALCGSGLFFTSKDAVSFCSFVLPELGRKITIDDPDRLLLNQIPLEPVVQFYLDAPHMGAVRAHPEFLYGEDRVPPFAAPVDLLRDARAERRAGRLLQTYLTQQTDSSPAEYGTDDEDALVTFLEEGVPALLAEGEVYLSDAFRYLQAAPPKISVGVSVQGSVLDLEVDTGEFPVSELKALLKSLHQKKRYHRLRDGRLLRLDDSLEVLDELNETLELSGAKLGQNHAQLPLYRAPSLDWALSGQTGVRFNRDDAFRRISRSFHAVKDSEYAPPVSLQKTLRKYQRDGYRWLRTLDGYGMGGILADDMGLGKTVQVLSYLLAMKQNGQTLPSLIVCPASLVLNWTEECQKFTPELSCVVVDGDAAHRAELAESWPAADLVVTSYDLLRRDEALYEGQEFYACILDEAQAIKNHTTQKYKAVCKVRSRVRFALTGTPVENRLGELWSIFSFLMPGYLPPYKSFCSRFEKPIVQEEDQTALRRLNQLTGPFILRRMKSDVLKELPPKTENVYRIELEEEQRKLYLAAVVDAREKLQAAKPEDRMAVFAVLMRLREICCDPRLIADNWEGGSAKLDACAELVSSAVEGGHRILLFSQFTSMLELLAKRLDAEGISHFTLQGSTPKPVRAELVRRFNGGEVSVFLISLRAGGTGLNLTAADIVIHYDPWWNVAAQNQATDRAYRIGQQNPVQVYKLIAQGTIEEKIVELQQAKQSLADTVTGTADGAILSMRPDELLQLLEGSEP